MADTILVIDDSSTNLELTSWVLEQAGFTVKRATSGEDGLECARTVRPALVLCDIHMPGIDGIEVRRRLAADPLLADIPVIALTATTTAGDISRILAEGFVLCIDKPVSPRTLPEQVSAFLKAHYQGKTQPYAIGNG